MHLSHKLPWNAVARHFSLITFNPKLAPHDTDIFPRHLPDQARTLNHFCRVIISVIQEFSETEVGKISVVPPPTDKLFSDELLLFPERKYGLGPHQVNSVTHNPLASCVQALAYWRERAATSQDRNRVGAYSSLDGDLADAIKMLIILAATAKQDEEEAPFGREALMVLMQLSMYPDTPIEGLKSLSWGHGFGFELVPDVALEAYLLLNIVNAVQEKELSSHGGSRDNLRVEQRMRSVSLLQVHSFLRFLSSYALTDHDHTTQNVPHRDFWHSLGITESWAGRQDAYCMYETKILSADDGGTVTDPLAPSDLSGAHDIRRNLSKYLKDCFAILYVYDVLLRKMYGTEQTENRWKRKVVAVFASWRCPIDDEAESFV